MSWADGTWLAYDCETTGLDVETARVVSAATVEVQPSGDKATWVWLVDPGVEIPAEATAVHGITTGDVRANGTPASDGVAEVAGHLSAAWASGWPVVVMNAPYDLTILDRELRRHGLGQLDVGPVLDPWVLDRRMDRYRPGKRTLADLCRHYGVRNDREHSAGGDALAALRVMWRMTQEWPELAAMDLSALQDAQARWHAESSAGLARWMRQKAEDLDGDEQASLLAKIDAVRCEWPMVPWKGETQ